MLHCILPCTRANEPALLSSLRGLLQPCFHRAALDDIPLRQADMVSGQSSKKLSTCGEPGTALIGAFPLARGGGGPVVGDPWMS